MCNIPLEYSVDTDKHSECEKIAPGSEKTHLEVLAGKVPSFYIVPIILLISPARLEDLMIHGTLGRTHIFFLSQYWGKTILE